MPVDLITPMDEQETKSFLVFLKNRQPVLYRQTVNFLRDQLPVSGMGEAAATTAAAPSVWSSISSALSSAVSSFAPLAQSYTDYQNQKKMLDAQANKALLEVQQQRSMQAMNEYENVRKMEFYSLAKALGIPIILIAGYWVYKKSEERKPRRIAQKKGE